MHFEAGLKAIPLLLTFGGWLIAPRIHRTKELTLFVLGILFVLLTWLFIYLPQSTSGMPGILSFAFNRHCLFVGAIMSGALLMGLFPVRNEFSIRRSFLLLLGAGVGILLADNLPTFFLFFFLSRAVPAWGFIKNLRGGQSHSGGTFVIEHVLCLLCALVLMGKAYASGLLFTPMDEYPKEFFSLDVLLLSFVIVYEAHGIFPFHSWLHDAVDHLRWHELSALILPRAGVLLFAQFMLPHYSSDPDFFKIMLLSLSIFSSVYWSFRGMDEDNIQKGVAYFYIAQMSLTVTGMQATEVALRGSYLHLMVISFSGTALWSILSFIQSHTSLKKSQLFYGLAQDYPKLATLFCLFGFCLIGVPLLASFVTEDLVINGLLQYWPYLGLGHILATCLNGIFFFMLFSRLFLGTHPAHIRVHNQDLSLTEMFPYLMTLIMMFFIGVFPFIFLEKITW